MEAAIRATVLEAFGAERGWRRALAAGLSAWPVRRLAALGRDFDAAMARGDSPQGPALQLLRDFSGSIEILDAERLPATGPLLIVANHAGMGDALGVFAATPRADIAVAVKPEGVLSALPGFMGRAIPVDPSRPARALRAAARRLRAGGAVLLFPAGRIEPDPALDRDAARAGLADWSESPSVLLRAAPGTRLAPVLVSGLVNPRALRSPLVRGRTGRAARAFAAATLQLLTPWHRDTAVRVRVGPPLLEGDADAVRAAMAALLDADASSAEEHRMHGSARQQREKTGHDER